VRRCARHCVTLHSHDGGVQPPADA
jgi:hypothetical protein